jgi:hypothetical protein
MEFISCVYNGLHETEFGGSLNRERHYMFSLRSLANMKEKITCYIGKNDLQPYKAYLNSYDINNIIFIEHDLTNFDYHNEIKNIRKSNPEYSEVGWNNRCVEVMWGKIWWLAEHLQGKDDDYKIFWIDAGLSHGGIFPKKYGTCLKDNNNPTYEESFQFDKAFNEKTIKWLDEFTEDGPIFFETEQPQYPYPERYKSYKHLDSSIIAGLFGGKKKHLQPILDEFKKIAKECIDVKELYREEQILTVIFNKHTEQFKTVKFNTWYHEDWDCFEVGRIPFSIFVENYEKQI